MDVKRLMFPSWHLAPHLSQGELSPSELSTSFPGCIYISPLMCLPLLSLLYVHVLFSLMDVRGRAKKFLLRP